MCKEDARIVQAGYRFQRVDVFLLPLPYMHLTWPLPPNLSSASREAVARFRHELYTGASLIAMHCFTFYHC